MGIYREAPSQGPQYQVHAEQVSAGPEVPTSSGRRIDWGEAALDGGFVLGLAGMGWAVAGPFGAAVGGLIGIAARASTR